MKLFWRVCMFFVALSYTVPSLAMAEDEQESNPTITISTNAETPKQTSLFVRCMRPPLRTIKTMTGTLSYILGSITILSSFDLLNEKTDVASLAVVFEVWLINKLIYHLSDFTLEEMS